MYINGDFVKGVINLVLTQLLEGDIEGATSELEALKGSIDTAAAPSPMRVLSDTELQECYQVDIDTTLYDEALRMDTCKK